MLPVFRESEPEYTENYQCTECGNSAIIPSLTIVSSQILTAIIGGVVTVFLFFEELARLLTAFQFNISEGMARHIFLVSTATLFIAGFVFILYRACRDLQTRKRYQYGSR
ncbi:MAG: hypothetical protein CSB48_00560 [Proteobacteria bacterium]|nr:MAG: hypothetical protein CSB48_00560 [Pseudomonadota bacterium]